MADILDFSDQHKKIKLWDYSCTSMVESSYFVSHVKTLSWGGGHLGFCNQQKKNIKFIEDPILTF